MPLCRNPEDMQEFSEMVLRLNGTEVSDGYDLVFAKSDGMPILAALPS